MTGDGWHETKIRIRYKDTDRMGVVYYGNYLVFFEVGRAELMRDLGYPYSRVEKEGHNLVVVEAAAKYHANVGYDSLITVRTSLGEVKGASVRFDYRVVREDGALLVTGHTLHACINSAQKPIRIPAELKRVMEAAKEGNSVIEEHGEVVFNRRVNASTWLMGIASPGVARSAGPGQFVMLRVRGGVDPLLRRPFSVCGVQNDLFHILYRVVGKGTEILSREVKKGDRLSVLGPLGRGFRVPSERGTSLLVAGGIGIAPLLFLASAQGARPFRFMAGFASAREIIPVGEISNLSLDADISTDDGSAGHGGLVTDLLEERLRQEGGETFSIYTCGPKPMLKKIASISAGRGLPCQGSLESAMACGLGACQGCAVKAAPGEGRTYYHVCKDGPVFDIQQIDWEAL